MRDFILNALPWIMMAVCVIFLLPKKAPDKTVPGPKSPSAQDAAPNSKETQKKPTAYNPQSVGITVGLLMGIAAGSLLKPFVGDMAMSWSIALGVLFGIIGGRTFKP